MRAVTPGALGKLLGSSTDLPSTEGSLNRGPRRDPLLVDRSLSSSPLSNLQIFFYFSASSPCPGCGEVEVNGEVGVEGNGWEGNASGGVGVGVRGDVGGSGIRLREVGGLLDTGVTSFSFSGKAGTDEHLVLAMSLPTLLCALCFFACISSSSLFLF